MSGIPYTKLIYIGRFCWRIFSFKRKTKYSCHFDWGVF